MIRRYVGLPALKQPTGIPNAMLGKTPLKKSLPVPYRQVWCKGTSRFHKRRHPSEGKECLSPPGSLCSHGCSVDFAWRLLCLSVEYVPQGLNQHSHVRDLVAKIGRWCNEHRDLFLFYGLREVQNVKALFLVEQICIRLSPGDRRIRPDGDQVSLFWVDRHAMCT